MGLLGALGGLGQGLTDVGKQLYLRRERALEEARKLAEEQRNREFKSNENRLDREAQAANTSTLEAGRASRNEALIAGRAAEGEANRTSREGIAAKNRAAQKELVTLRARLEASNEAAAKRLADTLSADDVHSVQYGDLDAQGRAEVFVVLKNGTIRPTGKKVRVPRNYQPYAEDSEDDGGL